MNPNVSTNHGLVKTVSCNRYTPLVTTSRRRTQRVSANGMGSTTWLGFDGM